VGTGIQINCPGNMLFGFSICGLASINCCKQIPNLCAIKNKESPARTVYNCPCGQNDGAGGVWAAPTTISFTSENIFLPPQLDRILKIESKL
jgi:hypothetical protein